ncbi:MAG: SPOR domain-containing protein [Saprospiraceae bacterium]
MSRLDYITIAIVAACILAIIFLVYKMTDLFSDKQPVVDPIEVDGGEVEQEDSTTYNYEVEDDATDKGEASSDSGNDNVAGEGSNNGSTTPPATTPVTKVEDEEEERTPINTPTTSPTRTTDSGGKYMVIAGTFSKKANAKTQLQQLKKLGYNNATVENFDRGKYDVILVDRFDNMAAAERLVKDLKAEGIKSYDKAKEEQ